MHRHWTERVGAIAVALWFAIVGLAPGAAGTCPTHQLAGASGVVAHGGGHAGMAGHAGHTMPSTDASSGTAPSDRHSPADHHSHNCTCPGSCCSAAALAVVATRISDATIVPVAEAPSVFQRSVPRAWADFVLPFPTPPPQATTA